MHGELRRQTLELDDEADEAHRMIRAYNVCSRRRLSSHGRRIAFGGREKPKATVTVKAISNWRVGWKPHRR
jgi:hypothetical protein